MKKDVAEQGPALGFLIMALVCLAGAFWAFFMALKVALEFLRSHF